MDFYNGLLLNIIHKQQQQQIFSCTCTMHTHTHLATFYLHFLFQATDKESFWENSNKKYIYINRNDWKIIRRSWVNKKWMPESKRAKEISTAHGKIHIDTRQTSDSFLLSLAQYTEKSRVYKRKWSYQLIIFNFKQFHSALSQSTSIFSNSICWSAQHLIKLK